MGKINKLPKNIWELIAAGEVVERPASVVKELIENSIDAGASAVTVEIMSGGVRYIRITDNGCGISREDVPLAFVSHATSKISAADDLDAINTLGFRGEALASIAAVSKTEIITKTKEESVGTRMTVSGSQQGVIDDAGCPDGTTIIIRDLFYNTPARMKFLKSDKAEGMSVAGIVDKIAISHPEISFRFIKDGKQLLCTGGSGDLKDAVFSVYGKEFSDALIGVNYELNGVCVKGFITKPFYSRGSGSMQLFFVNNRFIKSKTACAALNEAYKNSIMVGKYPACVLFLSVIPELVDVNVHPAKTEVRFSNEKAIFDAVYYAAKNALSGDLSRKQASFGKKKNIDLLSHSKPQVEQTEILEVLKQIPQRRRELYEEADTAGQNGGTYEVKTENSFTYTLSSTEDAKYVKNEDEIDLSVRTAFKEEKTEEAASNKSPADSDKSEINENSGEKNDSQTHPSAEEINFKYLGEAFKTYIFAEYNGKIIIIDKHAAHERMIYNSIKKNNGGNGSQMLLTPVSVLLSKEEYTAVTENIEILNDTGFEIDDFGNGSVIVRACPLNLEKEDITALVSEIASYLVSNKKEIIPEKLDWIYHSMACRQAIKAGNKSDDAELIEFTKQLLADESIRFCPHGRPVLVELTKYEIDKQFGRV